MTAIDPKGRAERRSCIRFLPVLTLFASMGAGAATLTVDSTDDPGSDDDQCTLREAVAAVNAGADGAGCTNTDDAGYGSNDTILFATAIAGETVQLAAGEGELAIDTPVTIDGGDPGDEEADTRITIDADGSDENASRVFNVGAETVLQSLVLTGGRANDGGAVLVDGVGLTADRVDISDSRATGASNGRGGGVFIASGGSLEFRNGTIASNTAERGGGAIYDDSGNGAVTLVDTSISQNRAGIYTEDGDDGENGDSGPTPAPGEDPADGGGLYLPTGGDIVDDENDEPSFVNDNAATGSGGGIWTNGATTIRSSAILNNTAHGDGNGMGGGNIYSDAADLGIVLSRLSNGEALGEEQGAGGGILADSGTVELDLVTMRANYATQAGGGFALRSDTSLTVTRSLLVDNGFQTPGDTESAVTALGGALHSDAGGTVNFEDGTLVSNVAGESGGAFWTGGQTSVSVTAVGLHDNTARGNEAGTGGGAFYHTGTGTLTIADSRLIGNGATGEAGAGGAILNDGSGDPALEITDSNFTRNSAESAGGAIETASGNVTLTRVTLGGNNSADGNMVGSTPGNGGAVHIGGGTVRVEDSTISYNTAVQGGGLWNGENAQLTVRNATITNNQVSNGGDTPGEGGGLYQAAGGTAELTFVTVARNSASSAGGGVAVGGEANGDIVTASASIIADNSAGDGADFVDGSVDFDEDTGVTGNNPGLDSLQLFGGPTLTHPLVADSPAVDHADGGDCGNAPFDLDQRGAVRTSPCDAGSFERTDDPVIAVSANGPDDINVGLGEDISVLAFRLRNTSDDQSVNIDGFSVEPLINGGYGALFALLPAEFEPTDSAEFPRFEVVADDNGNGRLDDGETTVVGQDENNLGRAFTLNDGGGLSLSAGESENLLIVFRTPDIDEEANGTSAQSTGLHGLDPNTPLYAGGMLLGLIGVFRLRGLRRRTRFLLALAVIAAGLTACSNADDTPPDPDLGGNNPELQGDLRFRLVQLQGMADSQDDVVIGDGLPVYGPAIFIQQ